MGEDPQHPDWVIQRDSYTVEVVAERVRGFIFEEHYGPVFQDWQQKPQLGFIVAGYTPGEAMAEEYQIDIENGSCKGPQLVRPKGESGATWSGEPEAISRLLLGFSPHLPGMLQQHGVKQQQLDPVLSRLTQIGAQVVAPAMPFQDAIDLAEFLVDLTIKFSRFSPGAQTVGGPIEIAAISKHEGFKWIRRKHYFSKELNSEQGGPQ